VNEIEIGTLFMRNVVVAWNSISKLFITVLLEGTLT
jgi:hypothetical protein